MNWLIDAQLPRSLASLLCEHGENSIHTLDLPDGNGTPDSAVIRIADLESRIVVTKDQDFVNSFLLHGKPKSLLLISTGNITNNDLLSLVETNLTGIRTMFDAGTFVELNRHHLILHG
jgi:predicted nuclease of predicted toxin-antitoxin system